VQTFLALFKLTRTLLGGTLINDEERQEGLIGWDVYWYYFKKGGVFIAIMIVFVLVLSVGARVVGSWWLTQWTLNAYNQTPAVCK
jgi:hypothetical protein